MKARITRTYEINDLTPEELADLFCDMYGDQQARFFDRIWQIAKGWPGTGWCSQSYEIARHLSQDGKEVVKTFHAHVAEEA